MLSHSGASYSSNRRISWCVAHESHTDVWWQPQSHVDLHALEGEAADLLSDVKGEFQCLQCPNERLVFGVFVDQLFYLLNVDRVCRCNQLCTDFRQQPRAHPQVFDSKSQGVHRGKCFIEPLHELTGFLSRSARQVLRFAQYILELHCTLLL